MNNLKLREMLGNLGNRIREVDDTYADKVKHFLMPSETSNHPVNIGRQVGAELGGGRLSEPVYFGKDNHLASTFEEHVTRGIARSAAIGTRYSLPAAGLTAAGAGLADLTANFYESMDEKTPIV